MEIAIGTPPVQTLVIADTGSDLTWTQCKPCNHCYPQHPPIFDPDNSSSYHLVSCPSDTCETLGEAGSCSQLGTCQYNYFYGDGSATGGDVATESITLGLNSGSPVTVPRITVGCGHSNIGTYDAKGSGIVGLGGGRLSLISQMEHLIRGRFSYCLAPFSKPNATSKISFGSHSVVSGRDVVSTPLVPRAPDTFYYVNLGSISLGSKNLPYKTGHGTENMVIDSGTTYNTIPAEMYRPFELALLEVVRARRVQIPNMGLCFETRTDLDIPQVTFHFKGGDLLMKPANIFARVSEDVVCLTILPATEIAILGSYGQTDFNVGFDLKERMVSFKPTDCTANYTNLWFI